MASSCGPLHCGLRPAGGKGASVKDWCQESVKGSITHEQRKQRRIISVDGYLNNQLVRQRGETCFPHGAVSLGLVVKERVNS